MVPVKCYGEAVAPLPRRLEPSPHDADALLALFNERRYKEAASFAQEMTVRSPEQGFGWKVLGSVFRMMGQSAGALSPLQRAALLVPRDAETHCNLGVTFKDLGRLEEAEASYRGTLEIKPDYAEAHSYLGNTLKEMGRSEEARACHGRALALRPNYAEAYSNLGNTLRDLGQLIQADASYRRALMIRPDYAEAYGNLGVALMGLSRLEEAEAKCKRALEIRPDYAEAYSNLGAILKDLARLGEAEASCRRALEIKPDFIMAHANLGVTLNDLGRLDEAEGSYRRALEIKPDYAEAFSNLGNSLKDLGRLDEAEASYRRALHLKSNYAAAHSNLIFALDLMVGGDTASLQAERKRWAETHAAHFLQDYPYPNSPDPERRLRVGYVSADFQAHSAAYVFGAPLVKFDRSSFDVVAYSNSSTEDSFTRIFQHSATSWRDIAGLSDDAAADMIRQDKIDILVDLSGHSAGNRLLVFARKPAPIQITAWGYIGGTGLTAIDVFFADPVIVPPEERRYYAEQVRYLPNVVSAFFPHSFPSVNTLPALSARGITFGSFNRFAKVSPQAYQTWAQVLLSVPNSRMVLKATTLEEMRTRARVLEHFTKAGVAPDRITLLGRSPRGEHLAAFSQIDISLDPFPHGGGVTALEGLMMGVPVVTLRWGTLPGRVSASILTTLGLTDWIAESPQHYVEIARQKAHDLAPLAELRHQLRTRLMSSVIGDANTYARAVENEYRQLWREWCGRQG